jgi:Sulfotransferase family
MMATEANSPAHVFVVGTGRSGTTTLSRLLSSVPGCTVEHEREPKLLDEVSAFVEGRFSHDAMVDLLRQTRAPAPARYVTGESNTQLSFVLPALAEAFPSTRVIWLIRDGRDVVASMVRRRIYHPHEVEIRVPSARQWARTRLQADRVGDLSADAWGKLDAFGRCCWLWSYTHRVIGHDLASLDLSWIRTPLEELADRRSELAAFCGLPQGAIPTVPHSNRSTRAPQRWHVWSKRQRELFRELCGPVMDELYPAWEEDSKRSVRAEARAAGVRAASAARAKLVTGPASLRARLGLPSRRKRRARRETRPEA